MKRRALVLTLLALTATTVRAQCTESRLAGLEKAIIAVVDAFTNRDEAALNALVSPDFGLAFIYRRGAAETFSISSEIAFDRPVPEYLPYDTRVNRERRVRFEPLPKFDCDEWAWSKAPGIYCDTVRRSTQLSLILRFNNEYDDYDYLAAAVERLMKVERSGHKIVAVGCAESGEEDFSFYLSWLDGRWCLVAIDRDEKCSA